MSAQVTRMAIPRVVESVYTHLDLDAMFAYYLLRNYGGKRFIGIERARLILTRRVKPMALQEIIARRELYIDCNSDVSEHIHGSAARLESQSASTIALGLVGYESDPHMRKMAEEVNFYDNNLGCHRGHLGSLLKMYVACRGIREVERASRWALEEIPLVHTQLVRATPALPDEPSFLDYVLPLVLEEEKYADAAARDAVVKLVAEEDQLTHYFGLKSVYQSSWRYAAKHSAEVQAQWRERVRKHVKLSLDLLYEDQVNFHSYRRLVKEWEKVDNSLFFTIPVELPNGEIRRVRCGMDLTDNPQAHTVLRTFGCMLTVVMNPSGNVTIQGDAERAAAQGILEPLDKGMCELAAMLRYADMMPEERETANWEVLKCHGSCPLERRWHLAQPGWLSLYNGTRNHAAPSTQITLPHIKLHLRHAFVERLRARWKRSAQVPKGFDSLEAAFDAGLRAA